MKRLFGSVFISILLGACTIASPLATTQQWLGYLQSQNMEGAISLMVRSSQGMVKPFNQEAIATLEEKIKASGKIESYEVTNSVPLKEAQLKDLGVGEGYEVYYTQWSERLGEEHLKVFVVNIENSWKVIQPND